MLEVEQQEREVKVESESSDVDKQLDSINNNLEGH
jgi:hypothetical protein